MLIVALFMMSAQANFYQRRRYTSDAQYRRDLQSVVHENAYQSHFDFAPLFKRANMNYPPKKLALLVFKQEKYMEIWANDGKRWVYLTDIEVLAASGEPGPKLHAGDRQVPEGVYHISMLNPYSKYDLSLMINYPDAFDKVHARRDHRRDLGGNIFIHGSNVSVGCVAIGDHAVEDLFVLVYETGVQNVSVIIAPNDLRQEPAVVAGHHPRWVDLLNKHLKAVLKRFPLDNA